MTAGAVARPELRSSTLGDVGALGLRHLRLMSRRPSSIVGGLVLPVVFAVLFFTVFGRVMDRAGLDYPQYLLPAVVVQSITFAGISGSIWAAEDASSGMVDRLRVMPVSRAAPIMSLLVGETARAVVGAAVLIGVGYAFGFGFQTGVLGVLGFFGIVIAAAFAVVLPYLVLGYALGDPEPTQAIGGLVYFPLLLVSTLFVPGQAYPDWLRPFAEHQPLSVLGDALRAVSTQGYVDTGSMVLSALAWCAGSIVVFGALAPRVFGRVR